MQILIPKEPSLVSRLELTFKTEHGGLKEDGTPDKRVGTGEFAQGKVDPVEAGKQGGQTGGSSESTSSSGGSSGGSGRKTHRIHLTVTSVLMLT